MGHYQPLSITPGKWLLTAKSGHLEPTSDQRFGPFGHPISLSRSILVRGTKSRSREKSWQRVNP